MSKLSIDNALNVLGIAQMPHQPQALDAAYQTALSRYEAVQGPTIYKSVNQLLETAYRSLQNAGALAHPVYASDPGYADRLEKALRFISTTPLSFELLGAWLWVSGAGGDSALFESELRASGFEWVSKKACWILKPRVATRPDAPREPWALERIRSAYAPIVQPKNNSRKENAHASVIH